MAALVFLLALVLRLAFVAQARDLPTQRELVMDALRYDTLARDVAAHGWRPHEVFYQAPLYPYALAAVYAMTGGSRLAVRLIQALLGALTAALLAGVSRRLFGPAAGLLAGLLAALYGPAIFYTPLLLKSTLVLLFEALLLLALVPCGGDEEEIRPSRALLAGVCLGVCALLQETSLLLVPFALPALLRTSGKRRLAPALALVLGVGLGVAPATLLNWLAGGELVLTSSQGGMNFYIGNARGANGTYMPLSGGGQQPEQQRAAAQQLAAGFASRETGRAVAPSSLSPGQVSGLFWRETARQIREDPARWARLLLRKTRLFWNSWEIPDAEGYSVYRREVGGLAWLWLGFGPVASLGLTGLWLAWREKRERAVRLLAPLAAGAWISVALFFVFGRYRLAVVPFLIPPAAWCLVWLFERLRSRSKDALPVLVVAALAALAVALPAWTPAERRGQESAIEFNLGTAAVRWADRVHGEAAAAVERGDAAQARERLGQALAIAERAAGYFRRAEESAPGFFAAEVQRGAALHRRGVWLSEAGVFPQALAAYAEAHGQLARALAGGGGRVLPEAERDARDLLASVDRSTAVALANQGARLIESGDLAHAEAALRRSLALQPRSAAVWGNLGLCLLQRGHRAESRAAFERALAEAGPAARPEETAFYRRGLELASR